MWSGGVADAWASWPGEGGQKTVGVVVLIDYNFVADQDWRTAGSVFVSKRTHRLTPKLPPIQVTAKQSGTTEKQEQSFAIACRSCCCRVADRMGLFHRFGHQRDTPNLFAAFFFERHDAQFFGFGPIGREKNLSGTNHRRRMT